jgi:hypothetical protein
MLPDSARGLQPSLLGFEDQTQASTLIGMSGWVGRVRLPALTSADPDVGRLTAMCSHTQITQFSMAPGDCRGDQVASHIAGDARVATVEAESLTVTASQGGTAADRRIFVPVVRTAGGRVGAQMCQFWRCQPITINSV